MNTEMELQTILTVEIIDEGKSLNGGWSLAQLQLLGFNSFQKGWRQQSIGKYYPNETIKKFLSLKGKHLKH